MFSRERLLGFLCLLFTSLSANALILEFSYQGTIRNIFGDGASYSVGDVFSGSLLIDTDLAPADRDPSANRSDHNPSFPTFPNFVTGAVPDGGLSFDRVQVEHNGASSRDSYGVLDSEINDVNDYQGNRTYSIQSAAFNVSSIFIDFINGQNLDQEFSFNSSDSQYVAMSVLYYHHSFIDTNYIRNEINDGKAFGVLSSVSLREFSAPISVSEPSALLLLCLSFVGLGYFQRKSKS